MSLRERSVLVAAKFSFGGRGVVIVVMDYKP